MNYEWLLYIVIVSTIWGMVEVGTG